MVYALGDGIAVFGIFEVEGKLLVVAFGDDDDNFGEGIDEVYGFGEGVDVLRGFGEGGKSDVDVFGEDLLTFDNDCDFNEFMICVVLNLAYLIFWCKSDGGLGNNVNNCKK